MNDLSFSVNSCLIQQSLQTLLHQLLPEINRVKHAIETKEQNSYGTMNLAYDSPLMQTIKNFKSQLKKKSDKPICLIVIAIGGSNLGTIAIHEAIHGKFYNETQALKIYFVDTVDSFAIHATLQLMKKAINEEYRVLINIISKSGSTIETIANGDLFIDQLKKHYTDYQNSVIVTTEKNSPLYNIAKQENFILFEIPHFVGGRFSVFSAVSLLPLAILDIDIEQLLHGAQTMLSLCCKKDESNYAAYSAITKFVHYQHNIKIHDSFLFVTQLESLGKWYRQLLAESIGKEFDKQGKKVEIGITPSVCLGSTDLHSVGQLFLAGPRDKFFTFISVTSKPIDFSISCPTLLNTEFDYLKNKSMNTIMSAILQGTQKTYEQQNRPFCCLEFPQLNEYYLGQFLQMSMLEIIYLGYLFNIDPFDQPAVELYKYQTRKILRNE